MQTEGSLSGTTILLSFSDPADRQPLVGIPNDTGSKQLRRDILAQRVFGIIRRCNQHVFCG